MRLNRLSIVSTEHSCPRRTDLVVFDPMFHGRSPERRGPSARFFHDSSKN